MFYCFVASLNIDVDQTFSANILTLIFLLLFYLVLKFIIIQRDEPLGINKRDEL